MEIEISKIERLSFEAQRGWGDLYYHVIPGIINKNGYTNVIEVGTAFGGHASTILKATIASLICIDSFVIYEGGFFDNQPDYDALYEFTKNRITGPRCSLFRGNSKEAFPSILELSNGGLKFDLVFIDADHSHKAAKEDIEMYSRVIREGGTLSGHDYNPEGFPGVCRAVDEFVRDNDLNLNLHDGYVWSVEL
jgi:cephalosporin hydroxylase